MQRRTWIFLAVGAMVGVAVIAYFLYEEQLWHLDSQSPTRVVYDVETGEKKTLGVTPFLSMKNKPELISATDFPNNPNGYSTCQLVVKDGSLYVRFGFSTFDPYVITDDIENVLIYSVKGEKMDTSTICESREIAYIVDSFNVYSLHTKSIVPVVLVETFSSLPISEEELKTYFTDTEKIFDVYGNIYDEIDVETFGFKNGFWADKNTVYVEDKSNNALVALPNSDPQTFELLEAGFSKDANTVFYADGSVLTGAGLDTFSYVGGGLGEGYAKNVGDVWFGSLLRNQAVRIEGADPQTFEYIGEYDRDQYAKDSQKIYRDDKQVYEGADPQTFKHVATTYGGNVYFTDAVNVYGRKEKLNLSPEGFDPLVGGYGYMKDAYKVVHFGEYDRGMGSVIEEADPNTFSAVPVPNAFNTMQSYFVDKNKLYLRHYCNEKSIEACRQMEDSIDLSDLVVSNQGMIFKDTDTVLSVVPGYESIPPGIVEVRNVHAPTYEVLGDCKMRNFSDLQYAQDTNGVYLHGSNGVPLPIDVETFAHYDYWVRVPQEHTHSGILIFAEDKNNVYVNCTQKLEGVSPEDFSLRTFYGGSGEVGTVGIINYKGVEYYTYRDEENNFVPVIEFLDMVDIVDLDI